MKKQLLQALESEKKGDWNHAHQIVQQLEHPYAYWIHAYLHRKEPDLMNASYWYSRAKKTMPDSDFKSEWEQIAKAIQNWKEE